MSLSVHLFKIVIVCSVLTVKSWQIIQFSKQSNADYGPFSFSQNCIIGQHHLQHPPYHHHHAMLSAWSGMCSSYLINWNFQSSTKSIDSQLFMLCFCHFVFFPWTFTASGGIKEEMVPGSKNQTSSDCGIPLPASKPKIWSLADTAACKTPPPIVQSQHGAWMTNPYHHSHTHPHSSHNPHSHQGGDLSSMMMGNSPTNPIGNTALQGWTNDPILFLFIFPLKSILNPKMHSQIWN